MKEQAVHPPRLDRRTGFPFKSTLPSSVYSLTPFSLTAIIYIYITCVCISLLFRVISCEFFHLKYITAASFYNAFSFYLLVRVT